jgi:hypothetical protein
MVVVGLLPAVDWALGRRLTARPALVLYASLAFLAAFAVMVAVTGHGRNEESAPRFGGSDPLWVLSLALSHVAAPVGLAARYFRPEGTGYVVAVVAGAAAAAGLFVVAVTLARRNRIAAFGVISAGIAYAPVSQLIRISRGTADSYLYLPMWLLAVTLAVGLAKGLERPRLRYGVFATVAACVLALALTARARTDVWKSGTALWADAVEKYPDEPNPVLRFGDALLFEDRSEDAVRVFEQLRREQPDYMPVVPDYAIALERVGRLADAERTLADGARRGDGRGFREAYALFLIGNELSPSDPEAAERSLVDVVPILAERGKRPRSLERAAILLDGFGHPDLAASMRRRARAVESRRR